MPQLSFNGSLRVVDVRDRTYTASVDPAYDRVYQGSVYAAIQPDRRYFGSVEMVHEDGPLLGYNGSMVAEFTPITPDRQISGSIVAVAQTIGAQNFYGSLVKAAPAGYSQIFRGSVQKATVVSKIYTATIVQRALDVTKTYTAGLKIIDYVGKDYSASAVIQTTVHKMFTASVRPFVTISTGEQDVYDEAVRYLISEVLERTSVQAQIDTLTARLAFLNDDITRVLAILNDVDSKPSVLLNLISPSSNLRRVGGETVMLIGNNFIPTCQVQIKQGSNTYGPYNTIETAMTQLTFVTPDFTGLAGLILTDPVTLRVQNPNGQNSEYLTFTLATT